MKEEKNVIVIIQFYSSFKTSTISKTSIMNEISKIRETSRPISSNPQINQVMKYKYFTIKFIFIFKTRLHNGVYNREWISHVRFWWKNLPFLVSSGFSQMQKSNIEADRENRGLQWEIFLYAISMLVTSLMHNWFWILFRWYWGFWKNL